MQPRPPASPSLAIAAAIFLWGIATIAPDFQRVGEVEAAWALPAPPAVLVSVDPVVWADPTRVPNAADARSLGPVGLEASQVRPTESLRVGGFRAPLAVNAYTGGLPDWPARAVRALVGGAAARALPVVYGLALVAGVWSLLRTHRAIVAAGAAALWLSSDWMFVFYRRALGGTEVWLIAASLLVVHGLWDRRWRGGRWAPLSLALGVGLGLHAKLTFLPVLVALGLAAVLTRWDRGALAPPAPVSRRDRWIAAGLVAALLLPLVIAALHHAALPAAPRLRSHDQLGLQVDRLFSGLAGLAAGRGGPAREQVSNLVAAVVGPLAFFGRACHAADAPWLSPGRVAGFAVVALGSALAWRDRRTDPSAQAALLRYLSLGAPLAAGLLFVANRDLHHLGALSGLVAAWAGLAVDRVAATATPPRSTRRGLACLLLLAPWMASGLDLFHRTPEVLARCDTPLWTRSGQEAVAALVRDAGARRVVLADYDLYGVLDLDLPGVEVDNAWGALSRADDRRAAAAELVALAAGGHYLVVRPTAPTIYGIHPEPPQVFEAAGARGLTAEVVGSLSDDRGAWATLYQVSR